MWNSVSKAEWDNVILEDVKKKAIQNDVLRFFRAEERYKSLGVPWKRGVIVSCLNEDVVYHANASGSITVHLVLFILSVSPNIIQKTDN